MCILWLNVLNYCSKHSEKSTIQLVLYAWAHRHPRLASVAMIDREERVCQPTVSFKAWPMDGFGIVRSPSLDDHVDAWWSLHQSGDLTDLGWMIVLKPSQHFIPACVPNFNSDFFLGGRGTSLKWINWKYKHVRWFGKTCQMLSWLNSGKQPKTCFYL